MKEKAKKLKHSLSNKKKHHDSDSHETDNTTPSLGVNLNDYEDEEEDAEYLGAPSNKLIINIHQTLLCLAQYISSFRSN